MSKLEQVMSNTSATEKSFWNSLKESLGSYWEKFCNEFWSLGQHFSEEGLLSLIQRWIGETIQWILDLFHSMVNKIKGLFDKE